MNTLLEKWELIYSNHKNYKYENSNNHEAFFNLFKDVDQYFIIPILAIAEKDISYIENIILTIESIYKKYRKDDLIYEKDIENIYNLLYKIFNCFSKNKDLEIYKEINQQARKAINSITKEIQNKAEDFFGKSTIQDLDFEFNNQYEASKTALENKEKSFIKWLKICFFFTVIIAILNGVVAYYGIENDRLDFILIRVLILFPVLWFLFFISSQIKEDRRIVQSYLHKKVVARSYLNYADSIQKRTSIDIELRKKMVALLLETSINVLKENPADLLMKQKEKNDEGEMQSIIEKLVDKLPTK